MNSEQLWNNLYKSNKNKWRKQSNLPKILKNKVVLELGVGNGKTLKSIIVQKPKEVIVIDFSQEAIKIINKDFPRIEAIKADITKLPFQTEQFDIVVCFYILNNLSQIEIKHAVAEIHRILKPKGKVIFEDFAEGDFRQNSKVKTIKATKTPQKTKTNKIKCHFFTTKEIKDIFKHFSQADIKLKTRKGIKSMPKTKRKTISGIIVK